MPEIKASDRYREEDEYFTPNPTDMYGRFRTSGIGPHQRIEEVSPIFEIDKIETADQIQRALDPDDPSVPESSVVLPNLTEDNETAREDALRRSARRLEHDVVELGGLTPAQREAAEEGPEGAYAAQDAERANVNTTSTGGPTAGVHDPDNTGPAAEGEGEQRRPTKKATSAKSKEGDDKGDGNKPSQQ